MNQFDFVICNVSGHHWSLRVSLLPNATYKATNYSPNAYVLIILYDVGGEMKPIGKIGTNTLQNIGAMALSTKTNPMIKRGIKQTNHNISW